VSTIEAIFLGIIQGLTEFLPISSSGHLTLFQNLLGFENLNQYIIFDLVCHLGTLCAIFLIFFSQIQKTMTTDRSRLLQVIVATLPLFPLVLILKQIKNVFDQPQYLGYCFLLSALLLYLGIRLGSTSSQETLEKRKWKNPFIIGVFQAIAILPGVSRSGSTISIARILGYSPQEAVTFSFLLAIPAILGGITLETAQIVFKKHSLVAPLGWMQYTAGFFTSFGVGYFSLKLLMKLAVQNQFIYFVWYCLIIGIVTMIYF